MRPTYARRRSTPSRPNVKLSLPVIQVAWIRLAAIGVAILVLLVLIAQLTKVSTIQIKGNKLLTTQHITDLTQQGLKKQWFGKNMLLINTSSLEDAIKAEDPGVHDANVSRSFFHTITVTVTERQPTLNWKSGGVTYLLDSDATVISTTSGGYRSLPTVVDSSNLPVKVGQRVAPTAFVTFCSELARQLPGAGYKIGEMSVPDTTSEVYVRTDKGITLKFDTTRGVGDELADLRAVQTELTKAKKTPTQYIDLRIEHKAYYK